MRPRDKDELVRWLTGRVLRRLPGADREFVRAVVVERIMEMEREKR